MLSDAHFRALGRLAHNAADLENIIEVTVHELVDEDPRVGEALTSNLGASQLLDRLVALAELRVDGYTKTDLIECAAAARRALYERNQLLHSRWVVVDGVDSMTLQVRGRKLDKRVQLEVTVEDVEDAARHLGAVATNFRFAWTRLVAHLGRAEPAPGSSSIVLVPNRWRTKTDEISPSPSRSKTPLERWIDGNISTAEYERATGRMPPHN